MNKRSTPQSGSVDELQQGLFEKELLKISKGLEYPRTPDIAGSVMSRLKGLQSVTRVEGRHRFISRRFAWSFVILLVLCSSLMLIPPARAAILEFIQIGVVRIFPAQPTASVPLPPPTAQLPVTALPVTATPSTPSSSLIPLLKNIAGETTLEEAQQKVSYPILLPTYPPALGKPDHVFVQDAGGAMTILVWMDPKQPDRVLMSLHYMPAGSWAVKKMEPAQIQETTVNGQRAIWAVGPYPLRLSNGDIDMRRLVEGHVLIWAEGDMTYRLETDKSLQEAIKIAESLKPIP
jgi:hypothetical protein